MLFHLIVLDVAIASAGVRAAMVANEVSKAQKLQQQQQQPTLSSDSDSGKTATTDGGATRGAASDATASNNKRDVNLEATMKEKYERLSGHMFTVMWYVTEIDIQSTLAAVCFKVI